MAVLALSGVLAAVATAWMATAPVGGILLAVLAFLGIGLGGGAAGTSLLMLLAARVAPEGKPAAASIVWIMMIAGFVVTTATTGRLLDPYSPERLVGVTAAVCAIAFLLACLAVAGLEAAAPARAERGRACRCARRISCSASPMACSRRRPSRRSRRQPSRR
jgi:BCD family chlorophyll transporter-like MFS transporter